MDGAGPLRRFWTITFLLLSPTMFYMIIQITVLLFKYVERKVQYTGLPYDGRKDTKV